MHMEKQPRSSDPGLGTTPRRPLNHQTTKIPLSHHTGLLGPLLPVFHLFTLFQDHCGPTYKQTTYSLEPESFNIWSQFIWMNSCIHSSTGPTSVDAPTTGVPSAAERSGWLLSLLNYHQHNPLWRRQTKLLGAPKNSPSQHKSENKSNNGKIPAAI